MGELRQQEVNLPSFRRLLSQVKRSISIPHMKMFESEDYVGLLPGMSRSSSERSSSSTGSNVCSKNLVTLLSKPDGGRSFPHQNLLWDERQQISSWSPDHDLDPPLWDVDIKDPSCAWDLDLSRQLATKLMMAGEDEGGNLHGQSDTHNPYALMSSMAAVSQDTSIHLNASTTDASGVSNPRFKTEICRNFKEKGTCLYGDLCQFAHGKHELRKDVVRHNKYKTKHCQKYWIAGYCAYGPRCNFIHQEQENQKFQGGSVTGSSMDTVAKNRAINPSPIPMTMKTAAQVMNLANLRKMGLSDSNPSGESSGSEDGKLPFSRGPDYDLQHYLLTREDLLGLEKFPTFVPRVNANMNQFGPGVKVGPVGSGRPRVVWPGA